MVKKSLNVELAYAAVECQMVLSLTVPEGFTVLQVIEQSGILLQCPEIDLNHNQVGIFSRQLALDTKVQAGDRVEIYRPLTIDPKKARRLRT